jgi:uncharacterized membrane protein
MVSTPTANPDTSLKKSTKIMPYLGIACALLSIILYPLLFSIVAVIIGTYSYLNGEKKCIIPITLGLLLMLSYIYWILRAQFA